MDLESIELFKTFEVLDEAQNLIFYTLPLRCPQEWQTREHGKVALDLVVSEPQMGFQNCSNCYITYIVLLIFLRTKDNIYNKAKVIQQEQ